MNTSDSKASHIVMIIDDTPENLALLSDTLSEAGYRVLVATDGNSALAQITHLKPDIILLDVMMPGLNGFDTCNRLKANPDTTTIPVLFMTAMGDLDNLLRGFDEGAVDYLVKPIRPPEVLARVQAHLKLAMNFQRAETALNNSPFAVMAVNKAGNITWLPESGLNWISSYLAQMGLADEIYIGTALPAPILTWLKYRQNNACGDELGAYESIHNNIRFTLKLSNCGHTGEYLLLLEKHTGEWHLEAARTSLGLTAREAEILMWISRGKTNKEMGLIMGTSPRTVNKHLEHIFEKLGVATRAAAVSMAVQRTSGPNSGS
jgi:CheY-like chemotaxis protein/DNA-binding CsgD family transcriptional regulator